MDTRETPVNKQNELNTSGALNGKYNNQLVQPLAQVVLPVPIDKPFSYAIPPGMQNEAQKGSRVQVSFGNRILTGVIVDKLPPAPLDAKTKPLLDVLDDEPAFTAEMLSLTRWIASYYLCSWGEVMRAALPSGTSAEQTYQISMMPQSPDRADLSPALKTVYNAIQTHGSSTLKELRKHTDRASLASLRKLQALGFIQVETSLKKPKVRIKNERHLRLSASLQKLEAFAVARASIKGSKQHLILDTLMTFMEQGMNEPSQAEVLAQSGASASSVNRLLKHGFVETLEKEVIRTPLGDIPAELPAPPKYVLHEAQENALNKIRVAVDRKKFEAFLLHGVTGSGKTEVYISALKEVLALGKTGIVLVPEIALTPQTVSRFRAHFGDRVAVLHSRMSLGERFDAWRNLRSGRFSVVIGPRSAILAPLTNIGLIVVDEEHESSYKQYDPAPRYHARDVAVLRASMNDAVCILGSATPSLESFVNARAGKKYTYLSMPNRVPVPGLDAAPLPQIRMIDLTLEKKKHRLPGTLSQALRLAISTRLERKEQIILLQNRRGYSSLVECKDCGWTPECTDCAVTLTYHKVQHHLRCHYCGQTQRLPRKCSDCGGTDISRLGAGTQRIEEELEAQFPQARLLRMDLDTTTGKNAHFKILDQFARGEADILIGTQMVAKGLDFGRVTLVGVINADVGMLMPDFRAEERAFQLLTQVAGRAGRSKLKGEVILQTRNLKHAALQFTAKHDYAGFAQHALAERRAHHYPPYGRVIRIEFRGPKENVVEQLAIKWRRALKRHAGIDVKDPQPPFISRIQKNYRYHIIIKAPRQVPLETLGQLIKSATKKAGPLPKYHRMAIDVDAVSLF